MKFLTVILKAPKPGESWLLSYPHLSSLRDQRRIHRSDWKRPRPHCSLGPSLVKLRGVGSSDLCGFPLSSSSSALGALEPPLLS